MLILYLISFVRSLLLDHTHSLAIVPVLIIYTNSRFAPTASGRIGSVVAVSAVRCFRLFALGHRFVRAGNHRGRTHRDRRFFLLVVDFVRLERFVMDVFRFDRLVGDRPCVVDDRHGQLVDGRQGGSRRTDAGITGFEQQDVGGVRLDWVDFGLDHLIVVFFRVGQLGSQRLGNEDFVFFGGGVTFGFFVAGVLEAKWSDSSVFGLVNFGLGWWAIVG